MDDLKLRFCGYSKKINFSDFFALYGELGPDFLSDSSDEAHAIRRMMTFARIEDYMVGKTAIYLKPAQVAQLDGRKDELCTASRRARLNFILHPNQTGQHIVIDIPEASGRKILNHRSRRLNGTPRLANGLSLPEISLKDKGLISFMKGFTSSSGTVLNSISWGGVALSFATTGYFQTNLAQKAILMACAFTFSPFSFISNGIIHSLEERPDRLSAATWMILLQMLYFKVYIALLLIFIAKLPSFSVVPGVAVAVIIVVAAIVFLFERPTVLHDLFCRIGKICCICKKP